MTIPYYYTTLAQVYGGGTYNTSSYQEAASNNNGLIDTGIALVSIVTVAALILLVAIVVRIWRRPRAQEVTVPVEATEPDPVTAAGEQRETLSR